jgi:thiol-disulfide isomerase/thioredoxin
MKKIYLLALALVSLFVVTACSPASNDVMMEKDSMMEKDDSMEQKDAMENDVMEKKDDSMMEEKDSMDAMEDDKMMKEDAMEDSMEKNDAMMEDDKMMKEDSMMQDSMYMGEALASESSSMYLAFNKEDYEKALESDKYILLYFYASWCPTCKEEQPEVIAAFNELNREDVIGFRVNYKDSDTESYEEDLAREFGISYQHTKVILHNKERILKSPESWDKERYLEELSFN